MNNTKPLRVEKAQLAATSVSVISTVKNEAGSIDRLVESLLAQTRPPDEIVIVDGGSTDGTVEIIRQYIEQRAPIVLHIAPGCNISQGRNLAIRNARGGIIASTDAGVVLPPLWLANLLEEFDQSPSDQSEVSVVSGFFVADCSNVFELAMGATVLPNIEEVNPKTFLPSSRSIAFRRDAWEAVAGYPEWLDYCEDLIFDLNLRKAGFQFAFAPGAVARFKPRGSLQSFAKQYFLYARGDGKANLWATRHAIRYITYTLGPLALVLGFWYKIFWLLFFLGAVAYLQRPYRRLLPSLRHYPPVDVIKAALLVPAIRLVGDVAKMVGYPVGVYWRLRNR